MLYVDTHHALDALERQACQARTNQLHATTQADKDHWATVLDDLITQITATHAPL